MGDLQCSVFANLLRPGLDAVVNISTSGQLGFVMPKDFQPENLAKGAHLAVIIVPNKMKTSPGENVSSVQYFPYFDNQYLAVAASLNGGNSLALFVKILQQWAHELGFSVPQGKSTSKIMNFS